MSRRLTNVTKLFSLVVILHLVVASGGTDVSQNSVDNNDNEISRGGRKVQNFTEIANRLMQIRGLLKQLFSDWNAGSDAAAADARVDGESEIEGFSVGRTFGRIRLIRQMVLPITFFGGFLTAIIFGIAKTGIINMLLIKAVLFLQMALIIGKLACGAKELFLHKSSAHEIVYYPQPQPSSHYGSPPSSSYGWKRNGNQEEVFKDYYPSPMEYEHQAGYVSPYNFVNHQQQASLNRDYIQPSSAISRRGIIKRSSGESMADSPNYLPNHRMPMATHAINVLPLSQLIESRSASQQTITHQNHNHNTNYPNY